MDRLFRIDFYPQDWIIDTARLEPLERGIYIQIVMMIYSNRGPIPNDEKHLSNICNCSPRMIRSVIKILSQKGFIQLSGEKIGQKRAEHELNIKRTHLETSANGGRKSGENKRNYKENNNLVDTEPQNPLPTPSPSPSPSPSPTAKDKEKEYSVIAKIKKPESVSEQSWNDFLYHRKTKKSPVTQTVLNRMEDEAQKIGWTLEQAMIETCSRGWQGFKAQWILNERKAQNGTLSKSERADFAVQQALDELDRQQERAQLAIGGPSAAGV